MQLLLLTASRKLFFYEVSTAAAQGWSLEMPVSLIARQIASSISHVVAVDEPLLGVTSSLSVTSSPWRDVVPSFPVIRSRVLILSLHGQGPCAVAQPGDGRQRPLLQLQFRKFV